MVIYYRNQIQEQIVSEEEDEEIAKYKIDVKEGELFIPFLPSRGSINYNIQHYHN